MTATDIIRRALETGRDWAVGTSTDMLDAPLKFPTPKGGNHPVWVMAHLAVAEGSFSGMLTGDPSPAEKWNAAAGQGTEPTDNPDDYPPLQEAIDLFVELRGKTLAYVATLTDADLDAPVPHAPEHLKKYDTFQSIGALLNVIALHSAVHIGQLCDARRADGRKPQVA